MDMQTVISEMCAVWTYFSAVLLLFALLVSICCSGVSMHDKKELARRGIDLSKEPTSFKTIPIKLFLKSTWYWLLLTLVTGNSAACFLYVSFFEAGVCVVIAVGFLYAWFLHRRYGHTNINTRYYPQKTFAYRVSQVVTFYFYLCLTFFPLVGHNPFIDINNTHVTSMFLNKSN